MSKPKKPNRTLQHERELRGWSQQKVAVELDTDEKRVGIWERGESTPSPFYRQKLCQLFGKNAREPGFLDDSSETDSQIATVPNESSPGIDTHGYQPIQVFVPDNTNYVVTVYIEQQAPTTILAYPEQNDTIDTEVATIKQTTLMADTTLSHQQSSTGDIFNLGILALALAQQQHGWTLDELQSKTLQEIKNLDDVTQQQGGSASRRQALKFLMGIPSAIFGLTYSDVKASLADAEEILPLYAISVPACWSLYYSGPHEWVEIETVLLDYFLHLTPLMQQASKCQKPVAGLLSQIHQLAAEVTLTREDL